MSADLLRRAAAVLRERAQDATPGPWSALSAGRFGGDHWYVCDTDEAIAYIAANDGSNEAQREPDADYIATMDPLVGLALADWLEAVGVEREGLLGRLIASYGAKAAEDFMPADGPEVAVARRILGEQA